MINEIQSYTQISQAKSSGKTEESQGQGDLFKEILKEATEDREDAVQNRSVTQLAEISSSNPISFSETLPPLQSQTEELLSQLELYSNQLENPAVSLKEVNSLLEDIFTNTQKMLEDAESSEDVEGDSGALKDLVSRVAITAQSEYIKFQRGEYI